MLYAHLCSGGFYRVQFRNLQSALRLMFFELICISGSGIKMASSSFLSLWLIACCRARFGFASARQRWAEFLRHNSAFAQRQEADPASATGLVATATLPPGREECLAGLQKLRRWCPDTRGCSAFNKKKRSHTGTNPKARAPFRH